MKLQEVCAVITGGASGLGNAEFCLQRVHDEMDTHKTYINCLTSGYPQAAMSPLPFPTDQATLDAALPILGLAEPPDTKLLWIHNTLELAEVECSAAYLPLATKHSLRTILDGLFVVVQASATKIENAFGPEVIRHPGYRAALIEASIVTNAALAAYSIQQEIGRADLTSLQTVYGVYLLDTRRVWEPGVGGTDSGLAAAPRDKADFTQLADAILRSERIAALLGSPP